jgi:hypothetical protein
MSSAVTVLACERDSASIVLVGNLNPAIFQPAWFTAMGILRPTAKPQVEVVSQAVTSFSTDEFRLIVEAERFTITSTGEDGIELILDIVVGAFQHLPHTPISQLGINRHMHFRAPTVETWHMVGHRAAPKEIWKELVSEPGLRSLTMSCRRPDGKGGQLRVTIQPSVVIHPGVFVDVNEHYDRKDVPTLETMKTLQESFRPSMDFSRSLAADLLDKFTS